MSCVSQELVGTLRGFDDYVNMVLDDVTEYEIDADGTKRKIQLDQVCRYQFKNHNMLLLLLLQAGGPSADEFLNWT